MKCHFLNKMVNILSKGHVRSLRKNLILCPHEQLQSWATLMDSLPSASLAFSAVSVKVLHGFQPPWLLNKSNEAKASLHPTSRMQSSPHLWSLYKNRSHSSVQLRLRSSQLRLFSFQCQLRFQFLPLVNKNTMGSVQRVQPVHWKT